jgi:hypothetical protein
MAHTLNTVIFLLLVYPLVGCVARLAGDVEWALGVVVAGVGLPAVVEGLVGYDRVHHQ